MHIFARLLAIDSGVGPQLCQQVANTHLEASQANVDTLSKLVTAHEGTQAGQLIKDFLSLSAKVAPNLLFWPKLSY